MCSSKGSSQVRIFLFFLLILILKSIIRLKYIHFKTSTIIILNCNKVHERNFIYHFKGKKYVHKIFGETLNIN